MQLFKKFQLEEGVENVEGGTLPVPGEFYGVSNELGVLLSRNISVDQLLEYVSTVKFHIFQLIAAILACHQADDDVRYSLTHPLTHSPNHLLTHLTTYSLTHSRVQLD